MESYDGANRERAPDPETLARIVTAARGCFRERGVEKTRMKHIAEGAGIARQTVYDFVANKTELVDRAIEARLMELGAQIAATKLPDHDDVGERLVDLMALVVEIVGHDEEYAILAGSLGERHAFQYLAGPSALTPIAAAAFAGPFEDARAQGRLRTNVSTQMIVEWLQGMLAMLAARNGLDPDHLRNLLREFALPAVLLPR